MTRVGLAKIYAIEQHSDHRSVPEYTPVLDGGLSSTDAEFSPRIIYADPTPRLVSSSSEPYDYQNNDDMSIPGPDTPIQSMYWSIHAEANLQKKHSASIESADSFNLKIYNCLSDISSPGSMNDLSFTSSSSCVASSDLPEVYLPLPSKSEKDREVAQLMVAPRNHVEGAMNRLRASLVRESYQRLKDGLAVTGKGVSKHSSDFATRCIPSRLLQVERGAAGWIGAFFKRVVEWILTVSDVCRHYEPQSG